MRCQSFLSQIKIEIIYLQKWYILYKNEGDGTMKIYRGIIACLLVVFIVATIIYVAYFYNEQRSVEDGILIWRKNYVTSGDLC